ncbi:hypothetical protein PFISCL1PPCAC_12862, partial [Pristionchus fissidentatus]
SRGSSGSRGSSWGGGGGHHRSSSGGGSFGRARINSYRGGSSVPLVSKASIGRGFFAPRTSSLMFFSAGMMSGARFGHHGTRTGYAPAHAAGVAPAPGSEDAAATALLDGADNSTLAVADDGLIATDEVLVIAHPGRPVLVATVGYFWGVENLPNSTTNGTDCIEIPTANDNGMFSVCGVATMTRCKRPSSEVPDFQGRKIVFQDGSIVSDLAWLCPASESCCEWECCDVTYQSDNS